MVAFPQTAFTTRQAAEVLGITVQAVHYLIKRGRLRAWCFGDRLCVSRRSVYSYKLLRETMQTRQKQEKALADATLSELKRRRRKVVTYQRVVKYVRD